MLRNLLPLLFVLLSGCSSGGTGTLEIDFQAFQVIRGRIDAHPLPRGWTLGDWAAEENVGRVKAPPGGAVGASLRNGEIASVTLRTMVPPGGPSGTGHAILLSRGAYAPAVELWHRADNATAEDIGNGKCELLPLENIVPPLRALPVDGRYPDDPSYPLIFETRLTLEGGDEALERWFEELGNAVGLKVEAGSTSIRPVVWIAAVGDLMLARGIDLALRAGERGAERVFTDVLPELRAADLLLGNLEGPVTVRGTPAAKGYTFRFLPAVLPALRLAGFDYLSVANNHAFDYGPEGFLETLELLGKAGIGTSGAGAELRSATEPWKTTVKGLNVTVRSVAAYPVERSGWNGRKETPAGENRPGVLWDGEDFLESLRSTATDSAFDIVTVHGGEEWQTIPGPAQRKLYESFIENGADLVLGSHPHVLQGLGSVGEKLIFYSLGNFVFPGMQETEYGEDGMLPVFGIYGGAVRYVRLLPVRLSGTGVSLDRTGRIAERFLTLTEDLRAR